MPLDSASVGASGAAASVEIDARWTMAFSAGLGDTDACHFDTRRPGGVVAHPLFPVSYEWPVFLATHGLPENAALTGEDRLHGVHASHAVEIARLVRPGDRLTVRATIAGVARTRAGAFQTVRLESTDPEGTLVCRTWFGSMYRGATVLGEDRPATDAPAPPPFAGTAPPRAEIELPLSPVAAHVYTECARIWNPIHTDPAVAARAGLPGIVLHGTATLAMAVSRIVAREAGGDPERVRGLGARFAALVTLPSRIGVRILAREPAEDGAVRVRFEVRNAAGEPAIRDGWVRLR